MKKINVDTQLISKIAGGFLTVIGISLLIGNDVYKKRHGTIHLTENDISVEDVTDSEEEIAKETSD